MPTESKAKQKILATLNALGYAPRSIEWTGPFSLVDFGSDGGFSVDGFGSFASADDFVAWINEPENFETFKGDTAYLNDSDADA